jgi:hypothetical protein
MTGKHRFKFSLLQQICQSHNVTLLQDYSNTFLTRDSKIIGKCILCDNKFVKSFNHLDKNRNFGCIDCTKKIKFEKIKDTMLEKYGVEYAAQLDEFKDKIKQTTIERYGCESARQNEDVNNKIKATNLKRYGCEYGLQSEEVRQKIKETYLERYGVENCRHISGVNEKIKETNLEKYGYECPLQNEEIKQKIKETNLEKYGCDYGFQNEEIKQKIKESNLKNYGVEHNQQRKEIKEKAKETCLKKYGVEHTSQCPHILEKITKNMYKSKEYIFPSGNIIKIQGYENHALDELINNNVNETDIITGCKNVPEIWYNDNNGKKRRHFVDIYIPNQNLCIEVKSTWTAKLHEENILLKQSAAKELGFQYEIWVYSKEGIKVECYK